jgi:hypothetical protein
MINDLKYSKEHWKWQNWRACMIFYIFVGELSVWQRGMQNTHTHRCPIDFQQRCQQNLIQKSIFLSIKPALKIDVKMNIVTSPHVQTLNQNEWVID